MWFVQKNTHAMTLGVVHEKNIHAMTLVDPYVVCEKNTQAMTLVLVQDMNTHAMTLVDPYVVCEKNTHATESTKVLISTHLCFELIIGSPIYQALNFMGKCFVFECM